jgi:hypothetical protein
MLDEFDHLKMDERFRFDEISQLGSAGGGLQFKECPSLALFEVALFWEFAPMGQPYSSPGHRPGSTNFP